FIFHLVSASIPLRQGAWAKSVDRTVFTPERKRAVMDTRGQNSKDVPLAVDLDGTLVSTDLLWEGIFLLLKKNFLFAFMLPVWLFSGKAYLKGQVAERVTLDASRLPYRIEFLEFLR